MLRTSPKNALLLASVLVLAVITGCKQSEPTQTVTKNLYPPTANAKADIAAAITQASQQHKNIILAFGGDWCGDCLVLDYYLHQPPNAELLSNNFINTRSPSKKACPHSPSSTPPAPSYTPSRTKSSRP
jgi:thiol:disulfide interchange protein